MLAFKNFALLALICLSGSTLFTACNNNTEDDNPPEVTIPTDALYYFVGTVDGMQQKIIVTLTNENTILYSNTGGIGTADCTFGYGCTIGNQDETILPYFDFTLESFYDGLCSEELNVFNTLFPTGSVPYFDDNNPLPKTVSVAYENSTGFYSSAYGDQTGSTFKITNSEEENNVFGKYQLIEGEVSCTLYLSDDPSVSILLENGEFKMSVGAYHN